MKRKPYSRRKRTTTKSVLRLPDLEHAKAAVLNSLASMDAQRGYRHEFVDWYLFGTSPGSQQNCSAALPLPESRSPRFERQSACGSALSKRRHAPPAAPSASANRQHRVIFLELQIVSVLLWSFVRRPLFIRMWRRRLTLLDSLLLLLMFLLHLLRLLLMALFHLLSSRVIRPLLRHPLMFLVLFLLQLLPLLILLLVQLFLFLLVFLVGLWISRVRRSVRPARLW